MKILVVDDLKENQLVLKNVLKQWGHEAILADNGVQAWNILSTTNIQFVITDWLMPEMDGIELTKKIRVEHQKRYTYIILLTSRTEKSDLVEGMEAGADDFIAKPFNLQELNVRVRAGERILKLQNTLESKNRSLEEHNTRMENDLKAAAELQSSLLPDKDKIINPIKFSTLFMPCSFVAGDIFDYFIIDEKNIGFYLLDVSGHGISSAMLSFMLSKFLSIDAPHQQNRLAEREADGRVVKVKSPAKVLEELNNVFLQKGDVMQYFTMVFGHYHVESGKVNLSLAGHPPPILLTADGESNLLYESSYPIGMFEGAEYTEKEVRLNIGDCLFIYSDGVSDIFMKQGENPYEKLEDFLGQTNGDAIEKRLASLREKLLELNGSDKFRDDISMLGFSRLRE